MAATVQSVLRPSHSHYHHHHHHGPAVLTQSQHHQQHQQQRRNASSKQRFLAEFSQCLVDFVVQLLPTVEELAVKEDVRKLLERLIRTIEPDSRLLSFGSTANGFSLRNSDMDLCCLIDSDERLSASDLVNMLGDLLERETKFHVKPLPHARIPIVKLNLDPSPGLPFGIACDIGFENRLALENTRLLMCYAMIDPARVRTMVLFLKVWSKRRKINSPYLGTLSSYGYVLLVIYFLVHVKNPPVLPNLQQMPPMRPISKEDMYLNGHNIWFFDDIELLRQRWQSSNTETVADLLIDFFKYFSRDFSYNTGVASIRAGLLKKESKGWLSETDIGTARERNRFCIEDPFETDFNVSRCVTKEGLFMIRGEFMRASRVLAARPERAIVALAQLCEERKDEDLVRVAATSPFVPPRLSPVPPVPSQTLHTVGSSPIRPTEEMPADRSIPQASRSGNESSSVIQTRLSTPPDHMAPRRGKWTSPPPPEASTADHSAFEHQLGCGLALATSSTYGRESIYTSSSNNSEILTDDERQDFGEADDCRSTQSCVEGSTGASSTSESPANLSPRFVSEVDGVTPGVSSQANPVLFDQHTLPFVNLPAPKPAHVAPSRIDSVRRPMISAKQSIPFGYAGLHQLPLSGLRCSPPSQTVFYETAGRIPTFRFAAAYPGPSISAISSQYDQSPLYHMVPASFSPTASLPQHVLMARRRNLRKSDPSCGLVHDETGSDTPTATTAAYQALPSPLSTSHSHSSSSVTIKSEPTTTASTSRPSASIRNNQPSPISSDPSSTRSGSPVRLPCASKLQTYPPRRTLVQEDPSICSIDDCTPDLTFSSSPPASISAGSSSGSPDSLSTSSNYATTPSSTSPPSPTRLNYIATKREGKSSPSMFVTLQQASKHAAVEPPPPPIGNRCEGGAGNIISLREFGLR